MRCFCTSLLVLALTGCGFNATVEGGSSASSSAGASSSNGGTASTGSSASTSSTTGTSGTSGTSSGSTGGTSGSQNSGDCNSNADCPGSTCVEVTPGGFRECVAAPKTPEACTSTNGYDQCCPDGSLTCPNNEACILGPAVPICSGVAQAQGNVCAADQCARDSDCGSSSEICVPAGTLGAQVRACFYAACRLDTDCTAHPNGKCEPVTEPCCRTVSGLYCVYPGGCRTNSDCTNGYCQQGSCVQGSPICPA